MIDITVVGVDYEVPSSAADVNWAAAQIDFEQALAAAVNTLSSVTWADLAYAGTWDTIVSEQSLQVSKTPAGRVTIRGGVSAGAAPLLTTLDSDYWPTEPVRFIVPCGASVDEMCVVTVNSNGQVNLTPAAGTVAGDVYAGTYINVSFFIP